MTKTAKSFIKLNGAKEDEKENTGSPKVPKPKIPNIISGSKAAMEGQGRGVVYLSHIPHGFYEKEMQKFFSQFGSVTNLRLGRSKKTGASRGYAFIEFRYADVAKIVAETMNNYLMFEKLLKCKVVAPEDVKASMFKGRVDPLRPVGAQARYLAKKKTNTPRTEEQEEKRAKLIRKRTKKATQKLAELGIEIPVLDVLKTVPKKRPAKTDEGETSETPEPAKKQKLETVEPAKTKKQKVEKSEESTKTPKAEKPKSTEQNGISGTEKAPKTKEAVPEKEKKVPESVELSAKKKKKSKNGLDSPKVVSSPVQKMKNPPMPTAGTTPKSDKVKIPKPAPLTETRAPKLAEVATPKTVEKSKIETPKPAVEAKTPKAFESKTPMREQEKAAATTPKQVPKPVPEQKPKTPSVTPKPKTPATTPKHDSKKTPAKSPGLKSNHLDLSALLGGAPTPKSKTNTPKQKSEKKTPKTTSARTPTVMEVDSEDDGEITLKTPPNIQKVKSRNNSRAASNANTPTAGAEKTVNLAKGLLEKLAEKKLNKGSTTPSTPKLKKK